MHGSQAAGVAPTTLLRQRRAIASATSPTSGFGGQELDAAMMIADGSAKGMADPVCVAHFGPMWHWAMAVWNE